MIDAGSVQVYQTVMKSFRAARSQPDPSNSRSAQAYKATHTSLEQTSCADRSSGRWRSFAAVFSSSTRPFVNRWRMGAALCTQGSPSTHACTPTTLEPKLEHISIAPEISQLPQSIPSHLPQPSLSLTVKHIHQLVSPVGSLGRAHTSSFLHTMSS